MLIVGCGSKKTMTFEKIFPGTNKTEEVTSIYIQTDSGHSKIITSPSKIKEWLKKVKNIKIVQAGNQEPRTGYLYMVNLYNGKKKLFSFTTSQVNDYYIQDNPKLNKSLDYIFNDESVKNDEQNKQPLRTDGKWVQLGHRLHYLQGTVKSINVNSEGKSVITLLAEKTYKSETDGAESPYINGKEYSFVLKDKPNKDYTKQRIIVYGGQVTSNDQDNFLGARIAYVESNGKFTDLEGNTAILPPKEFPYGF